MGEYQLCRSKGDAQQLARFPLRSIGKQVAIFCSGQQDVEHGKFKKLVAAGCRRFSAKTCADDNAGFAAKPLQTRGYGFIPYPLSTEYAEQKLFNIFLTSTDFRQKGLIWPFRFRKCGL
jgi:hypothetical protein